MGNSVELVKFRASKIIYPTPFPLSNLLTQSSLWELLINSILKFILCISCFKKTYLFLISLFMLCKLYMYNEVSTQILNVHIFG